MQQLLGLEDQLAQQEGLAQNPAQEALQELELQKTVLSSELSDTFLEDFMRATNLLAKQERIVGGKVAREVPIKDGYTFGRTALQYQTASKKKPGSQGKSFARLKEAGLSDVGAGFIGEALDRGVSRESIEAAVEKLAYLDVALSQQLSADLEKAAGLLDGAKQLLTHPRVVGAAKNTGKALGIAAVPPTAAYGAYQGAKAVNEAEPWNYFSNRSTNQATDWNPRVVPQARSARLFTRRHLPQPSPACSRPSSCCIWGCWGC